MTSDHPGFCFTIPVLRRRCVLDRRLSNQDLHVQALRICGEEAEAAIVDLTCVV